MHKFVAGSLNKAACATCRRGLQDHTAIAQCEACPNMGPCELFGDMLLCVKKCYPAELAAQAALKDGAEQRVIESRNATLQAQKIEQPMALDSLVSQSQKIDQGIEMSSDIWNAKTTALNELIKAIDSDTTVENKPYARAKVAMERIETFQKAIFDAENTLLDARIGLRHSKTYLNQIINDLREAEREEFRLKNIDYPTKPVKAVKTKSPGTKKARQSTKIDFTEVNKWAAYLKVSGNAIHAMMVQHGLNAKDAAKKFSGLIGVAWDESWS